MAGQTGAGGRPNERLKYARSGFRNGCQINSGKIRFLPAYIFVWRNNNLTISLRAPAIGSVPMTSLAWARVFTCAGTTIRSSTIAPPHPDVAEVRHCSAKPSSVVFPALVPPRRQGSLRSFALRDPDQAVAGDDRPLGGDGDKAEAHELCQMWRGHIRIGRADGDLDQRGKFFRCQKLGRMDGHRGHGST